MVTTSPRLWPISALPIGDSLESFCSAGSASVGPTIWNLRDSPDFWSLTWTRTPTPTVSVSIAFSSTTLARRSRSSSWAIRCSSSACSFLASSYSEFSEMSPNSRASLIRAATSRRLVVERCSISVFSFSSPSWVISASRATVLPLPRLLGLLT